jgi:serine-type D-Ala-D-Ala carboxypeptidase/endopeptidase
VDRVPSLPVASLGIHKLRNFPTDFLRTLYIITFRSVVLIALTIPLSAASAAEISWRVPIDDQIRNILRERIDERRESVGIVVGIIAPDRRSIISYGTFGKNDPRPVDGDTIFEIGSINKVFTTLLLSDLAQNGELSLDDPVGGCLPPGSTMPERGGKQITYTDLATHTSGLPLYPTNIDRSNPATANANYPPEKLYEFLSTYKMQRDIGADYEYSSFGIALLGHMLGLCAGMCPVSTTGTV